jgi:hypothetical protein
MMPMIEAQLVPEPSTLSLAVTVALVAGLLLRR